MLGASTNGLLGCAGTPYATCIPRTLLGMSGGVPTGPWCAGVPSSRTPRRAYPLHQTPVLGTAIVRILQLALCRWYRQAVPQSRGKSGRGSGAKTWCYGQRALGQEPTHVLTGCKRRSPLLEEPIPLQCVWCSRLASSLPPNVLIRFRERSSLHLANWP